MNPTCNSEVVVLVCKYMKQEYILVNDHPPLTINQPLLTKLEIFVYIDTLTGSSGQSEKSTIFD